MRFKHMHYFAILLEIMETCCQSYINEMQNQSASKDQTMLHEFEPKAYPNAMENIVVIFYKIN